MREILILGSLPSSEAEERLYESMVRVCRGYAQMIRSPLDTARFDGSDEQRYEIALEKVRSASLIIGNQTKPSTGQGIEIGYAIPLKKPILVVAEEGSKVSGLVNGCPIVKQIIYYDSVEDLEAKLQRSLSDLKEL